MPDADDEDWQTPRVIVDTSLQWELTPLIDVCKNLWAASYHWAGLLLGQRLARVLEELGRLDDAAACLPLTAEIDASLTASWLDGMLADAYDTLARVQYRQHKLQAAVASTQRAIAHLHARLQRMAKADEPEGSMQSYYHFQLGEFYASLASLYAAQADIPAAIASMQQAITHRAATMHVSATSEHTLESAERAWRGALAACHARLADLHAKQSNLPAARASYLKALEILLTDVGENDERVLQIREVLREIERAE